MNSQQTTITGHENNFDNMEANTIETLKTIKDRVYQLILWHPPVKGDYRLLQHYYKAEYGHKEIRKNPSPESIARAYRRVQEETKKKIKELEAEYLMTRDTKRLAGIELGIQKLKKLLPSERVLKKRKRREEIIRGEIHEV